jgi:ABC-2 type transport system ATP-binding protein
MSEYILECQELSKHYQHITAVDQLNLSIQKGEVFGLLGPNGAGKTTTILMMLGLTEPTSGQVKVCGFDATREPIEVKKRVGYLQDNVGFYEEMTAAENLELIAELNGIAWDNKLIDTVLNRVGLLESRNRKVGEFSRGMKQRLGIADLLVKDSEVVILDEPTLGLDPSGIDTMLELIEELAKKDGKTVIVSSHLLYQIQKICTRVGIFYKGKLVAQGTIEELQKENFGDDETTASLENIYKKYFEDQEVRKNNDDK